jgi:hypothetical protein
MTETTARAKTLAAKIAAASADVGGKLKADKRNNEQGYNYISADKVLAVSGQALADQGISIIPQIVGAEIKWIDRGNGKGRWDAHLDLKMLVTDGESEIEVSWAGWGSDYSVPDKANYKALTSGDKYFRMKLLSIGEGNEDGEHENDEDEQRPAPRQNGQSRPPQRPAQPPAQQRPPAPATQPAAPDEPPFEPDEQPAAPAQNTAPAAVKANSTTYWNRVAALGKANRVTRDQASAIAVKHKNDWPAALAELEQTYGQPA